MDVNGFLSGFGQDLGPDTQKIRSTAQDYYRRCATRTNLLPKEQSCRAAICVDLACSQHRVKLERTLAIKKCGVAPKDYNQTMAALMDVLKLGPNITIRCRSCYGGAVTEQEGVLVAAAFHLYCQAAGVRTSIQAMCASLKELGPISSELQRVEEAKNAQSGRGRRKRVQRTENEGYDEEPIRMRYPPRQPITADSSDEGPLDKRKAEEEGKTPEKRTKTAHSKRDKHPMNEDLESDTGNDGTGGRGEGAKRVGRRKKAQDGEGEGAVNSGQVFVGQVEGSRVENVAVVEPYEGWKQRILTGARERLACS